MCSLRRTLLAATAFGRIRRQAWRVLRFSSTNPARGFWVAEDSSALLGMASAEPMRDEGGAGAVIPGGLFLGYFYVVPTRWGEGIGELLLDAVVAVHDDTTTRRFASGRRRQFGRHSRTLAQASHLSPARVALLWRGAKAARPHHRRQ
jgi:GNAT superfamily N-acetyltransferase